MSIYTEFKVTHSFYIRESNRIETLLHDAQLQRKHVLKQLENCIEPLQRFELLTEHRYWKNEIMKLELALEEIYEKLRKETRKVHLSVYA